MKIKSRLGLILETKNIFFESFKSSFNNDNGLPSTFVQDNEVWSEKGVLRGLHYQLDNPQGKLVRAVVGSIIDVAVDIRLGSPTFGKFVMAELSSKNKKSSYDWICRRVKVKKWQL